MSSTRRPFAAAVLLTAAGVMACSIISPPLAWAAPAKPAAPAREPALSGPRVTDQEAPAVNNTFDGGSRPRDYGRDIPMNVYGDLLKSTLGPDAPEAVRVSEDQSKQIRQIVEEFTRTQREFGRKNREQLEALRKQAGEQGPGPGNNPGRPGANRPQAGQPGQPPLPPKPPAGGDDPMMGEPAPAPAAADEAKRNEARAKLEELRSQMPKPGDAQTKVWDLLSEPQREAMRLSIENWKKTEQENSNSRYLQQQREQRERAARAAGREPGNEPAKAPGNQAAPTPPNPPQPKPPAPASPQRPARPQNAGPQSGPNAAPGANLPPQVRDRALRLLERLTPEEREELFRRVEERLRERGNDRPDPSGRDRPGQPASGQPKPPSMDDVRVPPPPPPAPTAPPERQPR